MEFTITVKTEDGVDRPINLYYEDEINFSQRGIIEIDLTPLENNETLKDLNLYGNHIQEVDLNPLSSCPNLKRLVLGENALQRIELEPLSSCKNLEIISISHNKIHDVNLSPLTSCTKLNYLGMGGNQIEEVDLNPLSSCADLKELYLYENKIDMIDLTPLSGCVNLIALYLYNNRLKEIDSSIIQKFRQINTLEIGDNQIEEFSLNCLEGAKKLWKFRINDNLIEEMDLEPLSSCSNLTQLDLSNNRIQKLDLSPLINLDLGALDIKGNEFLEVDLTPLADHQSLESGGFSDTSFWASSKHLKRINILFSEENFWGFEYGLPVFYNVPVVFTSLKVIRKIYPRVVEDEPQWKLFHLMHSALSLLGISWCGMLDLDPKSSLRGILAEPNRDMIMESIEFALVKQIDKGGVTVGLDVHSAAEHEGIAAKADEIVKLRNSEMKEVEIGFTDSVLDLRALLLTAYGNQVLTDLGIGSICGASNLRRIKSAVRDIKFELKVKEGQIAEDFGNVSKSLAEYVWALADYSAEKQKPPESSKEDAI